MALGMPIVMMDSEFNKLFNEKHHVGLCVDPMDEIAVANAINYLYDHPDEAEQMGNNGRKLIKEKYNWEFEAVRLIELYKELEKNIE